MGTFLISLREKYPTVAKKDSHILIMFFFIFVCNRVFFLLTNIKYRKTFIYIFTEMLLKMSSPFYLLLSFAYETHYITRIFCPKFRSAYYPREIINYFPAHISHHIWNGMTEGTIIICV